MHPQAFSRGGERGEAVPGSQAQSRYINQSHTVGYWGCSGPQFESHGFGGLSLGSRPTQALESLVSVLRFIIHMYLGI